MRRYYFWLAHWDELSSSWKLLGFRRSLPATAELAAPVVRLAAGAPVHLGTVVCRSADPHEAEAAIARMPPPLAVSRGEVWRSRVLH